MTNFIKKKDIKNDWYLIDASNAIVGRLASIISIIIRGKNKAQFTPSMDHGDFVVVKNIDKLKFTGNKFKNKKYYKHTGYPGGIKETTPEKLHKKKPQMRLFNVVCAFGSNIHPRSRDSPPRWDNRAKFLRLTRISRLLLPPSIVNFLQLPTALLFEWRNLSVRLWLLAKAHHLNMKLVLKSST